MVIGVFNLEEEITSMNAMIETLYKENAKKDAQIKCENELIANLSKKFAKRSLEYSNKGSHNKSYDG